MILRSTILFLSVLCVGFAWADGGADHQVAQPAPAELGTSGGNINDISTLYCCSGTLGSLVEDDQGIQYILSNNHVLARFNQGAVGEPVNQPGMIDQNCDTSGVIATLTDFVEIKTGRGRNRPTNHVDAAIAQVIPGLVSADGSIIDIGTVSSNTIAAFLNQPVQKSGRTSGHTNGIVSALDVTVDVGYSEECGGAANKVARFNNQIRITDGAFSAGGDSGSLILEHGSADPTDGRPRAVGLLFAGSSSSTIANPIDDVLGLLGVSLVGGVAAPPGPTGSVAGSVTSGGNPVAGATVSSDSGQSTTTAGNGSYTLTGVAVGTRTISASATGYENASQQVAVTENNTSAASFSLTQATVATQSVVSCVVYDGEGGRNGDKDMMIDVHVVNDLGAPVIGATVTVAVTRNGSAFGGASATTDSSGVAHYIARRAADGAYSTTVSSVSGSLSFEGSTPDNTFLRGTDATPAEFCSEGASPSGEAASGSRVDIAQARSIKARNSDDFFSHPGVVGHGIGIANGRPVIEVYVANGNSGGNIPSHVENVPVNVIVTGAFEAR